MRRVAILVLAVSLAALCGCGITSSTLTNGPAGGPGGAGRMVGGVVHGGQNPVIGSVIQLWAVGTAGYGSAATPLISVNVTTDALGSFNITGDYACSGNPLVYLTATGGNTGAGNNSNLLMVAPLGRCNTLTSSTQIFVDEVTTVAAAYALGQFTNTATGSIGSWSYSNTGLANAFGTVNNLTDVSHGTALTSTVSGSGDVPQSEINTLANIMAACVNSVSSNASVSTACAAYFGAATPPGGVAPTDTFDAMVNIAHNPGQNVSTLFNIGTTNPPFNPALSSAPTDWTIGIAWKAQGPGTIAIDSAGYVWHPGYQSSNGNGTYVLTPTGSMTFTTAFPGSDLEVDTNDHAWLYSGTAVTGLTVTTSGGVPSISSYAGPFSVPSPGSTAGALAIDGSNNLWFTRASGLIKMSTSGTVLGTFTGGGYPLGASSIYPAVDNNGDVWITSVGTSVSEFSNSGVALSPPSGFSGAVTGQSSAAAIDGSNNVWLANAGNTISELSSTGTLLSPSGGYPNSTNGGDRNVAVDGSGIIWVTSDRGIYSFNSSGVVTSPVAYSPGHDGLSTYLAIDASGNLWFTGVNARGVNPYGMTEYIGIAAPVITPMASAIATHQLGMRPGTPIQVVLTSTQIPSTFGYNMGYRAQLHVTGGNTGTYLWSIASGALPKGITLNSSTGVISGTSTASGTSSFTVQVCDAQNATNCASRAFTLTDVTTGSGLSALGGESLLIGTYVIRVTGMQNAGSSPAPGSVNGTALVGALTLNGAGRINQGDFYVTNPQGSLLDFDPTFVNGKYTLPTGGNGKGQLVFTDGNGNLYRFSMVADNIVGGVAQEIRLTEFDDTQAGTGLSGGAMASGIGKLQTGGNSLIYLEKTFAFGLEGETPCTNYNNTNPTCPQTVAPFGALSVAGVLTGTSGTALSGKLDAAGVGTRYNNVTFSGTWTQPFGPAEFRGSLTLTYTGTLFPVPPAHFAYYPVSDTEFFFISTDSHANTALLSGDAIAQSGPFNTGSLNGIYLGAESVASGGDGQSVYGSTVNSSVHFILTAGSNAILTADQNNAGTVSQVPQSSSPYSVDSAGRVTFTQAGQPIYYLVSVLQGFGVEQPTAAGNPPGLIALTRQASTTPDASSLSGGYGFNTLSVPVQNTVAGGVLTADGVSAGTVSADQVSTGGLLSSPSQSLSYTVGSAGRGTLTLADGTGYILWLLSPTQWIALPSGADPKPLILVGAHQ